MPRKKNKMSPKEDVKKIGKVIAKAWADEDFKRRLIANPADVLREAGLEIPTALRIDVLQDSPQRRYLVLPLRPPGLSLPEIEREPGILCCISILCCGT